MLTLPEQYFFRQGMTKRLLVEAMADRLPESLHRRRTKLGFDTPQARWLRGSIGDALKRRVHDCQALDDVLDREACEDAFRDYQSGATRIPHFVLFRIACLAVWMERFSVQPA
jgi:asparagine synthase (glutamine-hydrolysing)